MTEQEIEEWAEEVRAVPGSPEWLAARRHGLGASEVAAILGLDKYKSGLDVWLEKRGEAPARTGDTMPQRIGRFAERMIADLYTDATGNSIVPVPTAQHPQLPVLFASADRMVVDTTGRWCHPVEIKNRGGFPQGWGEAGTDLVPQSVAVQVHVQMMCYAMPCAHVAALLGGNDLRIYGIERSTEIEATILETVASWWSRHMVDGIEPPVDGPHAADYLARKFRTHGADVIEADAPTALILSTLAATRAERKAIEADEERLELLVKAAIGEARGIAGPAGKALWSLAKGKSTINWIKLTDELFTLANVPEPERAIYRGQFASIGAPSRRFTFTAAQES